jgi:hypothetical protein
VGDYFFRNSSVLGWVNGGGFQCVSSEGWHLQQESDLPG